MQLKTIYDIGAQAANWSRALKPEFPDAEFILFEANPVYREVLNRCGFTHFIQCLSDPWKGHVEFYNGSNTGDSYYKERTSIYDNQGSIVLNTRTLDDMIDDYELRLPDFIKLDTQGSELDILKGAEKALEHASLILCECPLLNYNEGAPPIQDYLAFFHSRRFIPVMLVNANHIEDALVHIDILFMSEEAKGKYIRPSQVFRVFDDARLSDYPTVAIPA